MRFNQHTYVVVVVVVTDHLSEDHHIVGGINDAAVFSGFDSGIFVKPVFVLFV